jgi:predicted S18 family serine protease
MNSVKKLIALMIALTLFASPVLASETTGTITAGSQTVNHLAGSGGGGSVSDYLLQLQVQILELRIKILTIMIELQRQGVLF